MQDTIEAKVLSGVLAGAAANVVLNDWIWRAFGFKRRPNRGSFFDRFVNPQALAEERFLKQELLLITLVRIQESLLVLLPSEIAVAVFARVIELLVDGERASEEAWRASSFPTREAALTFIGEGLKIYRKVTPSEQGALFTKRMGSVIRQEKKAAWFVGVSVLLVAAESPIPNMHHAIGKVLEAKAVTGLVPLRKLQYIDLVEKSLCMQ